LQFTSLPYIIFSCPYEQAKYSGFRQIPKETDGVKSTNLNIALTIVRSGESDMDTKRHILNSVYSLLLDHKFDKITVEMILKESGVARSTFYKYFRDKYDALTSYYVTHAEQLEKPYFDTHKDLHRLLLNNLRFIYASRIFMKRALKIEGQNAFLLSYYEYSYEATIKIFLSNMEAGHHLTASEQAALKFYVSGVLAAITDWIAAGCTPQTPEELTRLLISFIPDIIRSGLH
jgi:AcrR family transcriptional regulator